MNDHTPADCEQCGHELFQLEGEYHCPACDSVSGFELTPEKETFEL